jgi:dihydrofolate synthase/folylpolyglutamate synthase
MLRAKDAPAFLAELTPHIDRAATVPVPGEPTSLEAEEAAAIAWRQGIQAVAAKDAAEGLRLLAHANDVPARILICGSLYLAGAVLAENERS